MKPSLKLNNILFSFASNKTLDEQVACLCFLRNSAVKLDIEE